MFARPPLTVVDRLSVTALESGDTGTVHAVFAGLSAGSRYLRFHSAMPRLTSSAASHLATTVPDRIEVLVARIGPEPVGLVRWARLSDSPATAEIAVEVIDARQGQGIGTALVDAALASARTAGIEIVVADVLAANGLVRHWAGRRGAWLDPETEQLCLRLRSDRPIGAAA